MTQPARSLPAARTRARSEQLLLLAAVFTALGCTGAIIEPQKGHASAKGGGPSGAAAAPNSGKGGTGPSPGSGGSATGTASSGSGGNPGGLAGSSGSEPGPSACDDPSRTLAQELGSAPVRRLSGTEYLRTLSDLFPTLQPELPDLPIEDPVDAFDNDARALGPSDVYVSRWEEIAFRYTRDVTANAATLKAFLPCAATATTDATRKSCGAQLIDGFGLKTHRRPLTSDEKARYQGLFDQQLAAIDFEAAVQLTAMAMLQAPAFLYRLETPDGAAANGVVPLDSFQMASRLSYFLWQRMPDQALFDAASAGKLTDVAEIERQARRMLEDPRARAAVADFHRQWLYFDRMLKEEHDRRVPELFPSWNATTQHSAHEELSRFVKRTLFDGEGTLASLFLSTETEVDAELAKIYGVTGPSQAGQWATVTLPKNERAGILTRIGFLAAHAHSANGSPPLRGAYVMRRLFCLTPGNPPPGADTSPPVSTGTALTNRELFEERVASPDCQGCHVALDSFGFGFEHYDAIGAYRDKDNGKDVDARVTLAGTDLSGEVDGALELSERLAQSTQVAECAISRWFRYSRGRGLEGADRCSLERLKTRFEQSGGNILELLVDVATSPNFRNRPVN